MNFKSEQEQFWTGDFGNQYTRRNRGSELVASNTALFSRALRNTNGVTSVLELGANIGLNLIAIQNLIPGIEISAVEINAKAASELRKNVPSATVYERSIHGFEPDRQWDLVITKTVLIHIAPKLLPSVYELLYRASTRYLLLSEYYEPEPASVCYRGHEDKLFKRDFAGELMDQFGDLRLQDYGFVYHRDCNFSQDDLTWFLLSKELTSK